MKIQFKCLIIYFMMIGCSTKGQSKFVFGPQFSSGFRMLSANAQTVSFLGLGYHLGFITSLRIKEKLFLAPGIAISQKGFYKHTVAVKIGGHSWEKTEKLKSGYFDLYVPVVYQIKPTFYLQTGLQCGILYSGTYRYLNTQGSADIIINSNLRDSLHQMDYGGLIGLGFKLKNGLCFDATANFGFRSIVKDEYAHTGIFETKHLNGRNLLITIGIYYLVELGKNSKTNP